MMKTKPLLLCIVILYLLAVFFVPSEMEINKRGRTIVQISYGFCLLTVGLLGMTRARGLSFKRKVLADKLLRARVFARSIPSILIVITIGLLTTLLGMVFQWNYMVDFVLFVLFIYGGWNIFEYTARKVEQEVEEM